MTKQIAILPGDGIGPEVVAEGQGTSKQEAQMSAAEAGIKAKGW